MHKEYNFWCKKTGQSGFAETPNLINMGVPFKNKVQWESGLESVLADFKRQGHKGTSIYIQTSLQAVQHHWNVNNTCAHALSQSNNQVPLVCVSQSMNPNTHHVIYLTCLSGWSYLGKKEIYVNSNFKIKSTLILTTHSVGQINMHLISIILHFALRRWSFKSYKALNLSKCIIVCFALFSLLKKSHDTQKQGFLEVTNESVRLVLVVFSPIYIPSFNTLVT